MAIDLPRAVVLYRILPAECAGYLERNSVGISLETIRQKYGGGRYQIKRIVGTRIESLRIVDLAGEPRFPDLSRLVPVLSGEMTSWFAPNLGVHLSIGQRVRLCASSLVEPGEPAIGVVVSLDQSSTAVKVRLLPAPLPGEGDWAAVGRYSAPAAECSTPEPDETVPDPERKLLV